MKRFSTVSMVVLALSMVVLTSCGFQHATTGDYYDAEARNNRLYQQEMLYGPRTIVVERDPWTGQYYQVSPNTLYNSPWAYGADPFLYRSPRVLNNGGGRVYRTPAQGNRPVPQQREEGRRQNDAAREQILGPKKN